VTYMSCGEGKFGRKHETAFCKNWFQSNFDGCRVDGSKSFSAKDSGEPITSHVFEHSSFAKHIHVHENGLVKIGKKVPFHKAAALACSNMTRVGGKTQLIAGPNIENEGIADRCH
jgi:aryl-alcohol dehydrogenase